MMTETFHRSKWEFFEDLSNTRTRKLRCSNKFSEHNVSNYKFGGRCSTTHKTTLTSDTTSFISFVLFFQ